LDVCSSVDDAGVSYKEVDIGWTILNFIRSSCQNSWSFDADCSHRLEKNEW